MSVIDTIKNLIDKHHKYCNSFNQLSHAFPIWEFKGKTYTWNVVQSMISDHLQKTTDRMLKLTGVKNDN